jgi:hypothetical protein
MRFSNAVGNGTVPPSDGLGRADDMYVAKLEEIGKEGDRMIDSKAMLELADEYERGLKKMEAADYEEFATAIPRHKLVIAALRTAAQSAGERTAKPKREWLVIESSYKNAVFAPDDAKKPRGYIPRDVAERLLGRDLGGNVWFTREDSEKMRAHPEWTETEPPNLAGEREAALLKRPFAFAVRRAPENGPDEWRLFRDEGEAREAAEQLDGDYEALYRVGDRRSTIERLRTVERQSERTAAGAGEREAIARILDPDCFTLPKLNLYKSRYDDAFTKADAILALRSPSPVKPDCAELRETLKDACLRLQSFLDTFGDLGGHETLADINDWIDLTSAPSSKPEECIAAHTGDGAMKDLPREITIGDKYGPAMKITNPTDAASYFEICVRHTMSFGSTRADAERIERSNLGYYAGYYDSETRMRVDRLFACAHPVFGAIAKVGAPTPEEALQAGFDAGKITNARKS